MLYLARAVHQHDAVMRGEHALLDQFTAATRKYDANSRYVTGFDRVKKLTP